MKKTIYQVEKNYFNNYREAEIFCIMNGIHCEEIYEMEDIDSLRYEITAEYNIAGRTVRCLCYELGSAIVRGTITAECQVRALRNMGIITAECELLPEGTAWFDDENWAG